MFLCAFPANASLEINLEPIFIDLLTPGSTGTLSVICSNEDEDFSVYLDILHIDDGILANLWDSRTGEIECNLMMIITAPVDPDPDFVLGEPAMEIAAGDSGSFLGPYPITDGYRIEFNREQAIGYAPNGIIGSVDLTIVPEPTGLFFLGIGALLVRRKTQA